MLMLPHLLALALIAADAPLADAPAPAPAAATPEVAPWELTLTEAIRVGLRNSPTVRVAEATQGSKPVAVSPGREASSANLVITPVDRAANEWAFRSEMMAHLRSVEQTYWALSYVQGALWSREAALKLGQEILRRERAALETGRANAADVAEAEQQVENFTLNLTTARADLATVERQFHTLLGLETDRRLIVAVTLPNPARPRPEWDAALASMIAGHPDIEVARRALADAEFRVTLDAGTRPDRRPDEATQAALDKQRAHLQEVVHRTTHSLARFFLEVDSNAKQAETARRLVVAAQRRLEAQRAFFDEGQVKIDRLLDALAQYANALAQEAQFTATYNTSLAAFEEAQGTILAYEGVAISAAPRQAKAAEAQVAPASNQLHVASP